MKNGKRPSLAQKKLLQENGLIPENWLIVKDITEEIIIVSRTALKQKTGKTKHIRKGKRGDI